MDKGVKIDVDWAKLQRELLDNVDKAQAQLDIQVLKDSTPYVPRDSGNLVRSGIAATHPGDGKVIWDAPYAESQYYGLPNKAQDRHPQAVRYWFEAAKAARKDAWLRVAKRIGGRRK